VQRAARDFAVVPAVGAELRIAAPCQFVHKPEPGVMPGPGVPVAGIPQPGDELNGRQDNA